MARPETSPTRAAVPKAGTRKASVPEDESADPVGPVRTGSAKRLAQQKADFTAEGAPAPPLPARVKPTANVPR